MTTLTVQERNETKPSQLRRQGIVPIGLVEKGKPTRKVQAPMAEVLYALRHTSGARMMDVQFEGESKKRTVIVKQVDHEILTGKIMTVTLAEISKNEVLTADVTVTHTGTPEAVENGQATVTHPTTTVKLHGKATEIPASVNVDISGMQLGDHINASDLELPKGIDLASSPDATLFSVQPLRQEVEPTEAAVEAQEEVDDNEAEGNQGSDEA